jgi:NitT/TauT family transport system permease protein
MTVPSIVILVVVLLVFGMGSVQVIVMTGIITLPFSYVNTLEGMRNIDRRLIEMARVYKIPRGLRLTEIYLPGIGAAVIAGLTLSAGIGVRAAILAEFMGARDGIGHSLFLSWTHLNTPELYSWILLTFALLAIIEFGMLRPLRNILLRWKVAA